ncbi:MAG: uracil-DNA glycosylase [Ignavibacteria bacterium]|nr:uracil-DNA glycosylase [Ignavibacteria bacterium]
MLPKLNTKNTKRPDCRKCVHFFITWNKSFPYGCKVYGFKSKNLPSIEIIKASGISCLKFEIKLNK